MMFRVTTGDDVYEVNCWHCGEYEVTRTAKLTFLAGEKPNYLLSALVRNSFEMGHRLSLSSKNIKTLLDTTRVPTDPFEIIDHLIQYIFSKSGRAANFVRFDANTDFPILFTETPKECLYYLQKAHDLGFIEADPERPGYRLTLDGWRRLAELRMNRRKSDQAFVAMWFDPGLDRAWSEGFKPALEQTGFKPVRIDLSEHNEKICDRIIAEIRKSALVVADFTGQRGGVYFEAGFAMGLSIPVIWTCSQEYVESLHFDTRQYNHIVWNNPEELRTKLINRIEATIPRSTRV